MVRGGILKVECWFVTSKDMGSSPFPLGLNEEADGKQFGL